MVPRTVSGPISVNAVRPVNTVNTVKGTRVNTARPKTVLSAVNGNMENAVKASGNPQQDLKHKGVIESGCSRHMTENRSYLTYYEEIDRGFVAFGGNSKRGKITGKGKIRTSKLDFEDVYFVKELKFNLFSVSQMCDKKNSVLFTDTECVVLSPDFKSETNWLFDIDALTKSMNYKPVVAGNQSNGNADPHISSSSKDSPDAGYKPSGEEEKKDAKDRGNKSGNPTEGKNSEVPSTKELRINQEKDASVNSTNNINIVSPTVNAASIEDNVVDENIIYGCADDQYCLKWKILVLFR
ncbi:hypothetical protein Tco_0883821 [Tanacetum coccineum]